MKESRSSKHSSDPISPSTVFRLRDEIEAHPLRDGQAYIIDTAKDHSFRIDTDLARICLRLDGRRPIKAFYKELEESNAATSKEKKDWLAKALTTLEKNQVIERVSPLSLPKNPTTYRIPPEIIIRRLAGGTVNAIHRQTGEIYNLSGLQATIIWKSLERRPRRRTCSDIAFQENLPLAEAEKIVDAAYEQLAKLGIVVPVKQPPVIWLTGLPASGKTTVAGLLVNELLDLGFDVEWLDGDQIREIFPKTGFDREEREDHLKRIGHMASRLQAHGVLTVCSFVSPFRDSRKFVRDLCDDLIEVHVSTPLAVCESRDPKGLYKKARDGKLLDFTGVSSPYEAPLYPEVTIDTSKISLEEAARKIVKTVLP